MVITRPNELDYDDDLYELLGSRDKDILVRFFNCHCHQIDHPLIEESAFTKDELRKIIASKLVEQYQDFLRLYRSLAAANVRTAPAIEYLATHFDIDNELLDVSSRYELLIVLFEEDLIEHIDELRIRARIRPYAATNTFVFSEPLSISNLEGRLREFHRHWNVENDGSSPLLVDMEYSSNRLVIFRIYKEVGPRFADTFSFRLESDSDEVPIQPETTQVRYYKLNKIRIQLEVSGDETEIIFTDSFSGWYNTLDPFFELVFGIADFREKIDERKSAVANEIEQEIATGVETDERDVISRTQDTIDNRKLEAKEEIDASNLPDERKTVLKDSIDTIAITGSEIIDDQSIQTQQFRLIAELDRLFNTVDGIEIGFRELIKHANPDNQSFVLNVNNRPVQLRNGAWRPLGQGGLRDVDRTALQFFMGDTNG